VHLHQLVILEALGGTPSKRHWLDLLDDSNVFSVELSVKIMEEPQCCFVRGLRLPRRSDKGESSGIEVLSDFLSTWLKDQAVS
jgi:hypothetical protein